MADKKISQLSAASTPLAGTELVELVQSGTNVKATAQDVADLVDLTTIQSDISTLQLDVSNNTSDITVLQLDVASLQTGKQDNITLTTTGTSGAATLVGSTLNIPQYSGGGGGIPFATASGTDTYTATVSPSVTSYADGDAYLIRFTNGNTDTSTLNINTIGAKTLYRNNDGIVIGGDIWAGAEMLCVYNSLLNGGLGGFQCIGTSPNSLFAYVVNADSVTINRGQPVFAFGSTGNRMSVKLANNSTDATSAQTYGLVYSTSIAAGQKGIIIIQGVLDGLNLGGTWNDGDPVYLGATAGTLTKTKPYAPNHLVYLGVVERANAGNGIMYVRVQNGYELDELHNVQAQSPTLKDTLWYDNTVSPPQWKTASISTILGYTPEDVANKSTTTTLGTSNTLYPTQNAVKTYVDSGTTTLTNKRITARTGTVASTATPSIDIANVDYYSITALATAITSVSYTGTPTIGQTLWISITDNGTARAIAWGSANWEASGNVALPTTTVLGVRLDVAFIWNEATSKWRCVGVA